jgi:hypothetical protein
MPHLGLQLFDGEQADTQLILPRLLLQFKVLSKHYLLPQHVKVLPSTGGYVQYCSDLKISGSDTELTQ